MTHREIIKRKRELRQNAALKTDYSYCVNREVVCTTPKFGGNSALRPSVVSEKSIRRESTLNNLGQKVRTRSLRRKKI